MIPDRYGVPREHPLIKVVSGFRASDVRITTYDLAIYGPSRTVYPFQWSLAPRKTLLRSSDSSVRPT